MTLKAYYDTIKAQTGKTPQDFKVLAEKKGLLQAGKLRPDIKTGQIVDWLKDDYGLGRGHAMAIVLFLQTAGQPGPSKEEQIAKHFAGNKAHWRKSYDNLLAKVEEFGKDVSVVTTDTYISLLRRDKKFAILAVTAKRFDIGIKHKGVKQTGRFEAAGAWNSMVTHRVKISEPAQIDAEVLDWLKQAYEFALPVKTS